LRFCAILSVMRPHGTSDELERRRRRAIALLQAGQTYRAVARSSGASLSSIVRWFQAFKRRGPKGLLPKPTPGRPCRLSSGQKRSLERILLRGAQAAGYSTELWTLRRIGEVIRKHFGVPYSTSAVWRLLVVDMEWSPQKPERRATQRDEAAIERWRKEQWPQIKKKHVGWVPTSHFATKAGSS
jgi:transposase